MGADTPGSFVLKGSQSAKKNVYFIGPYGSRVSFVYQQTRALNLIWALVETKILKPKHRVAVVGGGIAGVMAAAAAATKSASVLLYEKEGHPLQLQERAGHRFIHPSINFWPEVWPLSPGTAFPFFDWHAGDSVTALDHMRADWERLERHVTFRDNTTVKAVEWNEASQKVEIAHSRGGDDVDIAIVAAGFGLEETLGDPAQSQYWTPDDLDSIADRKDKDYLVSGTGDGGIIDALRLAYPGFMKQELALEFLYLVDKEGLRHAVEKIEGEAERLKDVNERSLAYAVGYGRLAEQLKSQSRGLFQARAPRELRPVQLVGRFRAPFELSAAPIHKLILAHALAAGDIDFIHGEVNRTDAGFVLTRHGRPPEPLLRDKVVIRHGAARSLEVFLSTDDAEDLRKRQEDYGGFTKLITLPDCYFDISGHYPCRVCDTVDFARLRRPLVRSFTGKCHGMDAKMKITAGRFSHFEVYMADPHDPVRRRYALPDSIYGLRLRKQDTPRRERRLEASFRP